MKPYEPARIDGPASWWGRPGRAAQRWATAKIAEFLDLSSTYRFGERRGDRDLTERSTRANRRGRWQNIQDLRRMYKGEAEWGNQYAGVITDYNAAMQWGNGIRVVSSDEKNKEPDELKLWNEFADFNDLNEEYGLDLGVCGELDGQVLVRWSWDEAEGHVRLWTVPLLETEYEVLYDTPWYPSGAILDPNRSRVAVAPEDFVFMRLRGIPNGTYGIPTCGRIIPECENLDKALTDLRAINNLFASPTPIFQFATENERKLGENQLQVTNWRIGKAFTMLMTGGYKLHEMSGAGSAACIEEITLLVKMISGCTSVPVNFLGFPDLLGARLGNSVAADGLEPSVVAAQKAQRRYAGGVEEIIQKVLPVYAAHTGHAYDPAMLKATFPASSAGNMLDLINTWLPVVIARKITHRTFLVKIGIEDPDGEIAALVDEASTNAPVETPEQQAARAAQIADAAAKRVTDPSLLAKDNPIIQAQKRFAAGA